MIIHNPSLESCEFPQKYWARLVQPSGRFLETNRQTNFIYRIILKQSVEIYLYIFKLKILIMVSKE